MANTESSAIAQHESREDERPHACWGGWVYLGFETEEDGELVEITDKVRCIRCSHV